MNSLLIGLLLIAALLQMPTLPPSAELGGLAAIPCPTPAIARSYTVPAGFIDVYALLDDTVFGVLTFDKEGEFMAAFVYENGKVVVFTSIEELNKKHALCDDAREAAIRKKGI